jgi:hypothetical protein
MSRATAPSRLAGSTALLHDTVEKGSFGLGGRAQASLVVLCRETVSVAAAAPLVLATSVLRLTDLGRWADPP